MLYNLVKILEMMFNMKDFSMKLNSEEEVALEFFSLNKDFSLKQLDKAYNYINDNKYLIAMKHDSLSIDEIEAYMKKYYQVLTFYLVKSSYYNLMVSWYFEGISKENGPFNYTVSFNNSNAYLLSNSTTINDSFLMLDLLYNRLNSFSDAVSRCKTEEEVKKIFSQYVVVVEVDINSFKRGELGKKARFLNDFKEKININFKNGSSDYQDMVRYFLHLLSIKYYDEFEKEYKKATYELNERILANLNLGIGGGKKK